MTRIVAPRRISPRLAFSAAGFIATSTSGASPGVRMSRDAKWIWNAETPATVPAGARISAGKSGSVARSLPNTAVASVKRLPGKLHAVAGVSRHSHDDSFARLSGLHTLTYAYVVGRFQ